MQDFVHQPQCVLRLRAGMRSFGGMSEEKAEVLQAAFVRSHAAASPPQAAIEQVSEASRGLG